MTRIPVTEARPRFAALVARVEYRGETFILTKYGRDVAVLAPVGRTKRPGSRAKRR